MNGFTKKWNLKIWPLVLLCFFLKVNISHPKIMGGSTTGVITKPTTLKVVLVEFADVHGDSFYNHSTGNWVRFNYWHHKSVFEDLLTTKGSYFGTNSDGDAVHGSFRDYFWEISRQTYDPIVSILNNINGNGYPVWVTLTGNKTSYGFSSFLNAARTAATAAGYNVSTSSTVRVCYIYAGRWCSGIDVATTLNGPEMAVPAREPENRSPGESQTAKLGHIGYYCHEFGHMMGMDHPGTDVNHWCLMLAGHKNGDVHANRPAPMNPWFLYKAGWVNKSNITDYEPNTNLDYNPNNYFVRELSGNRRYLIENRQQGNNFDGGLPHVQQNMEGGLLIWRINDDGLDNNETTIIPADNIATQDWANEAMDMFRPTGSISYNKITDYTSPANLKLSSIEYSHFAVVNYHQNDDPITIDFVTNYWEGSITSNITWPATISHYYVGDNITIENGAILTLNSGAVIDLNGSSVRVINGTLNRGTNVAFNPDIRLLNGTTLKGQYPTIQSAMADATSSDQIIVYSNITVTGTLLLACNVLVESGASVTFNQSNTILNGKYIRALNAVNGTFVLNYATFSPDIRLRRGNVIKGFFPSTAVAMQFAGSDDLVEINSGDP